jgi:hypothetical protein
MVSVVAALAASFGLLFGAATALAQGAPQACTGDIATYCKDVPQGEGRVAACLRQNQAKLSAACRQGIASMATLLKEVVAACEDDLHRYCAGAKPGTAKECLRTNFRELSPRCKRELFEAKKAM